MGPTEERDDYQYNRETIEDMMKRQYDYGGTEMFTKYQPVLYEIIKDPQELQDRESLVQTHDKFLDRTEKLL
jgi:hypothetical protein